jgi:protein involved in sex pheromone biosynthesis
MKKTLILALIAMISSCTKSTNKSVSKVVKEDESTVQIETIMGEVDHGLTKVTLNDTTDILIYRGIESCTMIQLK